MPTQQIFEIAKSVRSQHITLIARYVPADRRLAGEDVEMVLPKVDHHFLQLPFRINVAKNAVSDDRRQDLSRGLEVVFCVKLLDLLPAFTLLVLRQLVLVLAGSRLRSIWILRVRLLITS